MYIVFWNNMLILNTYIHIDLQKRIVIILTLLLLNTTYPVLANSVDPDQLA